MTSQRDLKIALIIMVISLITGIICYATPKLNPPEPGDQPLRIMFENPGGKVLFTHSVHIDDYGIDCEDCHHEIGDTYSCSTSDCHGDDEDLPSRKDALHDQCAGCHDESGAGPTMTPEECALCHLQAK